MINTGDANVVAEPGSCITMLQLSDEDLRILKLNSTIGTNSLNTYFTLQTEMLATPQTVIIQPADLLVDDASGPVVASVDFDLNTGSLVLMFDEYTLISLCFITKATPTNFI